MVGGQTAVLANVHQERPANANEEVREKEVESNRGGGPGPGTTTLAGSNETGSEVLRRSGLPTWQLNALDSCDRGGVMPNSGAAAAAASSLSRESSSLSVDRVGPAPGAGLAFSGGGEVLRRAAVDITPRTHPMHASAPGVTTSPRFRDKRVSTATAAAAAATAAASAAAAAATAATAAAAAAAAASSSGEPGDQLSHHTLASMTPTPTGFGWGVSEPETRLGSGGHASRKDSEIEPERRRNSRCSSSISEGAASALGELGRGGQSDHRIRDKHLNPVQEFYSPRDTQGRCQGQSTRQGAAHFEQAVFFPGLGSPIVEDRSAGLASRKVPRSSAGVGECAGNSGDRGPVVVVGDGGGEARAARVSSAGDDSVDDLRQQVHAMLEFMERKYGVRWEDSGLRHVSSGNDPRASPSSPMLVLPPPDVARSVKSPDNGAVGVSTTPFRGLDVLFRTPKDTEADTEASQDPPSPSRVQVRWASPLPATESRSPRKRFACLTWCAGEGEAAITARGGRLPHRDPDSPPSLNLSQGSDVDVVPAADGTGGEGGSSLAARPRAATELLPRRIDCSSPGQESTPAAAQEVVPESENGGDRGDDDGRLTGKLGARAAKSSYGGAPKEDDTRDVSTTETTDRNEPDVLLHEGAVREDEDEGEEESSAKLLGDGDEEAEVASGDDGGAKGTAPLSLMGYMRAEILGAEDHGEVDGQANKTVRNFLTVPRHLERMLVFAMVVCLDTFLYVTTFLPIRILIGLVWALVSVVTGRIRRPVNRPLLYDLMRGVTIAAALCTLQFLEMSRVYHYIRGQAMVKLYVLVSMVEIFDKLMCSFGQDAWDSLYLSTVHKKKRRVLMHFIVVCLTVSLHSLLLFVHVTTLTVAVNSADQSLLTLLISNNFAEIKGSVFKKFDKQNLFQLSCHDVVERFKLVLFLAMIVVLNVCQGGVDDPLSQFLSIFALVLGGEVLADWIKHGFIVKFNQLMPSIYEEFSTILARDVAAFRKDDGSTLDHTHFVARRLAFATVPLNCVMIRFIQIAAPKLMQRLPEAPTSAWWAIALLFYFILLALKVLSGIWLMAKSCILHPDDVISSKAASPWLRSPVLGPQQKSRKELSLERLATIERFTLWKGRIV